jgi:hypothetical protein
MVAIAVLATAGGIYGLSAGWHDTYPRAYWGAVMLVAMVLILIKLWLTDGN